MFGAATGLFINSTKAWIVGGAVGATILVWVFAIHLIRAAGVPETHPPDSMAEGARAEVKSAPVSSPANQNTTGAFSPIITSSGNTIVIGGGDGGSPKRPPATP
jgi:hypothetical protein